MKKWDILVLLIYFPVYCFSQPYHIRHIGLDRGLSNSYIQSITQDKDGCLWFATELGLNRFDGNDIRVYKKNSPDTTRISGNELNRVMADNESYSVWIATQRDGLCRFDCATETFTTFNFTENDPSGISGNDITDIKIAKDGNLWLSFYYEGVDYYDKATGKFIHYNQKTVPGLISDNTWSVAEDNSHNLYIGHVDGGLSVISTITKQVTNYQHNADDLNSLPDNNVRVVFVDKQNNLWLGTDSGLAYFNHKRKKFITFRHNPKDPESLAANRIFSITQLSNNSLWIGTENGGISILDTQQSLFTSPSTVKFINLTYTEDGRGLSNNTIRSIYEDSFHNIWMGTFGGGVDFIGHQSLFFKKWSYSPFPETKNSLTNKVAWGICVDNNNRVWVGTDGGGINVFFNGRRIKHYSKENGDISDNAVLAALCDSQNNLWFGTFSGGVNKYNTTQKTFSRIHLPDKKAVDIRCFYEDDEKNIWIGTEQGIFIYNLKDKKITTLNSSNSALAENQVRSIFKDENGYVWVGTFGNGLTIFPPGDFSKAKCIDFSAGIPSNTIHHIFCDSQKQVWVSTGEGLVRFGKNEYNSFSVYNEKNGLSGNVVYAVCESPENELWISTNSGITHFIPNENKWEVFNHYDGVSMGVFMGGAVAKNKQGVIYFGGQNGVCYFNPLNKIKEQLLQPPAITKFVKYKRRGDLERNYTLVPVSDEIQLSYKENTFEIGFNVLDYSMNNKVGFRFRLKNFDDTWHDAFIDRKVTYRNIPPGSYSFELKAKLKNQDWLKKTTTMNIDIIPPIWWNAFSKSIYIILSFLLVLSIIMAIIRNIKKKLQLENSLLLERQEYQKKEELNTEKLKFFTNMTHEIKTPLTLIIGPIEDMLSAADLPFKLSKKVALIHKNTIRLLNMVNHILDFRKTEEQKRKLKVSRDDLSITIEELVANFKELNTHQAIEISVIKKDGDYMLYFDREIIISIMNNLLSNALKNTKKGKIQVFIRRVTENVKDYTEIEVKDTGIGISKENMDKIFERYYQVESDIQTSGTGIGLAYVKNLVNLHQGRLVANSEPGVGSSFRVQLLSKNSYPEAIHVITNEKQQQEKEPKTSLHKITRKVVLLVEDELDIQNYIFDSLNDRFEVITAANGKIGFEMAISQMPDIIISDILMPEMDGIEFCKTLKNNINTSHIPVILLTAKDTLQDKMVGYQAGADSYLTKPFSISLLVSRITNILESREKLATLLASYTAQKKTEMQQALNKLDNDFIESITRIVEDDLSSDSIGVESIAKKMNMSHSSLYRKVKALLGISVNEFIRKVKIRHAEKLLLSGKYSISEVSYLVGINSLTYFRQCFKEEYGDSPSKYLKKIKN